MGTNQKKETLYPCTNSDNNVHQGARISTKDQKTPHQPHRPFPPLSLLNLPTLVISSFPVCCISYLGSRAQIFLPRAEPQTGCSWPLLQRVKIPSQPRVCTTSQGFVPSAWRQPPTEFFLQLTQLPQGMHRGISHPLSLVKSRVLLFLSLPLVNEEDMCLFTYLNSMKMEIYWDVKCPSRGWKGGVPWLPRSPELTWRRISRVDWKIL